MKFRNLFLLCFVALLSACSDNVSSADDEESFDASAVCPENLRGTFTDERDGQVYKYTTIGSKVWMAEISAEYALSTTLTLRAFFQTNINTPFISNAYPNPTTKGGLTVRFSF